MIHNILSSNEIAYLLNDPIIKALKESLSDTHPVVKFSISVPDIIKAKLENSLSIDLSQIEAIPMRWIKGDTLPHIDKGEDHFNNTYLVYLTDSIGDLIIDGQTYPITAGDAHIFSEGLAHSTINTGNSERLMIGPMSESGFGVGASLSIIYFRNEIDAAQSAASVITDGIIDTSKTIDTSKAIGLNGYEDQYYTVTTVVGITSWNILTYIYGGNNPSPNGGPYSTGAILNDNQITTDEGVTYSIYFLYPTPRVFSMGSLFTNNAQVYYKPNSLSTGGGGSGVKNSRHKQRRT